MQFRLRVAVPLLALVLVLGVATDSLAQRGRPATRDPILMGNPRRDAGGSCVYNRAGKAVFTPAGKTCRDRQDHLSEVGDVDAELVASYPPRLRDKLTKLLSDHGHIATDIARLRYMIRQQKPAEALKTADKISAELTAHSVREEEFFKAMGRKKRKRR